MSLSFGLPHDREHFSIGLFTQLRRLLHRLVEKRTAGCPGVAPQCLGVGGCLLAIGLCLVHRFASPPCRIDARPFAHRVCRLSGCLKNPTHLATHSVEFRLQVTRGRVAQLRDKTLLLGLEIFDPGSDPIEESLNLDAIGSPHDAPKLCAPYLLRGCFRIHPVIEDTERRPHSGLPTQLRASLETRWRR